MSKIKNNEISFSNEDTPIDLSLFDDIDEDTLYDMVLNFLNDSFKDVHDDMIDVIDRGLYK